jgi:hypothetical protein
MNRCVCYSNTEQHKTEVDVYMFEREGKGRGDLYYRHAHTPSLSFILEYIFDIFLDK